MHHRSYLVLTMAPHNREIVRATGGIDKLAFFSFSFSFLLSTFFVLRSDSKTRPSSSAVEFERHPTRVPAALHGVPGEGGRVRFDRVGGGEGRDRRFGHRKRLFT